MNLKQLFSAKDMTQGPPWKRIAEFAVPMLLGNLAQQLYNLPPPFLCLHSASRSPPLSILSPYSIPQRPAPA